MNLGQAEQKQVNPSSKKIFQTSQTSQNKTNIKENGHKPGNEKEMIAPSPRKIA